MPGSISFAVLRRGHATHLSNVVCTLGRTDRAFPEVHEADAWTIAMVRRGTFRYRGTATDDRPALRPGWLLLGRPGSEFECSHDHDGGDECASLVLPEAAVDDATTLADRSARRALARVSALPPQPQVAALLEHACRSGVADLDEIGCLVAEAVVAHASRAPSADAARRPSDVHRAHDAMAHIEAACTEPLSLGELAHLAGLSPFQFLRVFRRVTGTTPHQYLIGARIRLALRLLLDTGLPVTRIAFDTGFQDLSNFNHTFRRSIGCTPRAYRRGLL